MFASVRTIGITVPAALSPPSLPMFLQPLTQRQSAAMRARTGTAAVAERLRCHPLAPTRQPYEDRRGHATRECRFVVHGGR
jgi:hypothetical protein